MESWTTPFDRDGNPEKAFLTVRTPDDARVLAVIDDAEAAAVTVASDIAGAKVRGRTPTVGPACADLVPGGR